MVSILCKKGSFFLRKLRRLRDGDLAFCNAAGGEFFSRRIRKGKKAFPRYKLNISIDGAAADAVRGFPAPN